MIENALSIALGPFLKLRNWWNKRKKNKGIKEQLIYTIEIQIDNYIDNFDKLNNLGEKELFPLIDSVETGLTYNQSNKFYNIFSKIINIYSNIYDSFADLSMSLKMISINPAFMGDLREASSFLYDFVVRMADAVNEKNVVEIDDRFYSFLKLYEKEFTKEIKKKDINKAIDLMKPYLLKLKTIIFPSIKRRPPRRKASRKIVKSFKSLRKTNKRVKITPSNFPLMNYIPDKLQTIMIIIEKFENIE